jgi:hypothetical protein
MGTGLQINADSRFVLHAQPLRGIDAPFAGLETGSRLDQHQSGSSGLLSS